jgi:hypothetical protein
MRAPFSQSGKPCAAIAQFIFLGAMLTGCSSRHDIVAAAQACQSGARYVSDVHLKGRVFMKFWPQLDGYKLSADLNGYEPLRGYPVVLRDPLGEDDGYIYVPPHLYHQRLSRRNDARLFRTVQRRTVRAARTRHALFHR